jgi:micrococcal nuclease
LTEESTENLIPKKATKQVERTTLFLFLTLFSFSVSAQIKGFVTWVSDGDTFKANTDSLGEIKIRLSEIDAPELQQEFGQESKKFLTKTIWKDSVLIFIKEKDQYGRYVAKVMKGKANINHIMVKKGYAWHFKKFSDSKILASLEDSAMNANIGLWMKSSPPQAPWEFRKIDKLKKSGKAYPVKDLEKYSIE